VPIVANGVVLVRIARQRAEGARPQRKIRLYGVRESRAATTTAGLRGDTLVHGAL
jgi:hypothetical protein